MNIIDAHGLLEDSGVPTHIYCKALGIEGYALEGIDRDVLIHSWRLHPPEAGLVTVYTSVGQYAYWCGAPPPVRVVLTPTMKELPALDRTYDPVAWELRKRGLSGPDARKLVDKPPTAKHSQFATYLGAVQDASAWEMLKDLDGKVPEMVYLGDYAPPADSDKPPYSVTIVTRVVDYKRLADRLRQAQANDEIVGLDVETDEEENFEASLVGIGLAFGAAMPAVGEDPPEPECYYLPLNGPLALDVVLGLLRLHFVERTPVRWVGHNGKYDGQALALGLEPNGPLPLLRRLMSRLSGDGLIAAGVLNEVDYRTSQPLPRDLKSRVLEHFGVRMLHFKEMLDLSGAKRSSEAPLGDIGPYCCGDAYWGVRVEEYERRKLTRYPKLLQIYERLELPTVKITADMEVLGIPLDYKLLKARREQFHKRVEVYRLYLEQQAVAAGYVLKTERKMCPWHGKKKVEYAACSKCDDKGRVQVTVPFNPNSGAQVEAVLQGVFGLPRMASTDGGAASNDEASLLRLREFTSSEDAKDWITMKLAWSKDNKVLGTYLGNPDKSIEVTGQGDEKGMWDRMRIHQDYNLPPGVKAQWSWFIHPTWNQTGTGSSRYSSKNPNGQNIPLNQRDLFSVRELALAVKR